VQVRANRPTADSGSLGLDRLHPAVIDAAYLEDGEWTVVDYKTDRPEIGSPRLAGYEAQVSLYADILERATGQRAKALLLFV